MGRFRWRRPSRSSTSPTTCSAPATGRPPVRSSPRSRTTTTPSTTTTATGRSRMSPIGSNTTRHPRRRRHGRRRLRRRVDRLQRRRPSRSVSRQRLRRALARPQPPVAQRRPVTFRVDVHRRVSRGWCSVVHEHDEHRRGRRRPRRRLGHGAVQHRWEQALAQRWQGCFRRRGAIRHRAPDAGG